MKVRINNRKNFNYLIIFIIGCIIGIPLLSKNINIYANSGFYDIAEGYEFTKCFQVNDGKILCSFFNYLGSGDTFLKSPISIMLLFLGNYLLDTFVYTYKIIVFLSLIFSGIYMHKFIDKITQNKNISLLASLLYMSAPFHLNQIFINNSISSALSFIFIPIIFLGLYKLLNTTEHSYHLGFGIIGLILTDFNLAIITFVGVFFYLLINIKNIPIEHSRKELVLNIIAIIGVTSFFIFPLIEANLKTDYIGSNSTKQQFLENRLSIKSLFVTEDSSEFVFELGPHIIIMLAFSVMTLNRLKQNRKEYIFAFIMMILYLFMSTKIFPWNIFPDFIKNIEHSYNFLTIALFFESIVCSINMSVILKKFSVKDVLIIFAISFLYLLALKGFIPHSNEIYEIKDYDLSELGQIRFMPQKAYNNIEYLNNRSRDIEILKGNATIYDKGKFLTYYNVRVDTLEDGTIYEFPYLYYPGYEVTYDGIVLDYFESDNGLIAVEMDKEEGTLIEINYVGTKLMNITKIISFVILCGFLYYVYKKH